MKKKVMPIMLALVAVLTACGQKTEAIAPEKESQREESTVDSSEKDNKKTESSFETVNEESEQAETFEVEQGEDEESSAAATEAVKTETDNIDNYINSYWSGATGRWGYTITKVDDQTVNVEYEYLPDRYGYEEGHGTGYLKDGELHMQIQYTIETYSGNTTKKETYISDESAEYCKDFTGRKLGENEFVVTPGQEVTNGERWLLWRENSRRMISSETVEDGGYAGPDAEEENVDAESQVEFDPEEVEWDD